MMGGYVVRWAMLIGIGIVAQFNITKIKTAFTVEAVWNLTV